MILFIADIREKRRKTLKNGVFAENSGGSEALCGWFCAYTPVEILSGLGLNPARIRAADRPVGPAEEIMHANICPWVKSILNDAVSGDLDRFQIFVFLNSCDAMRRLFEVLGRRFPDRFSVIADVPKKNSPVDLDYFTSELRNLIAALEHHLDRNLGGQDLLRAITDWNAARDRMRKIIKLRSDFNPLKASFIIHAFNAFATLSPVEFASRADDFLSDPEAHGDIFYPASAPRLMLAGNIIDNPKIIEILEQSGGAIVADDLCSGERLADPDPDPDAADPVTELARTYLNKIPCPRMLDLDARAKNILSRARESGARGVIVHTLKFCDNHHYDIPGLRSLLEKAGLPALFIEGDYSARMLGPVLTRVEAFVEMLGDG